MFGTLQRWGFNDQAPRSGITTTTDGFVIVRANSSNRMIIRIYYIALGATTEIAFGGEYSFE